MQIGITIPLQKLLRRTKPPYGGPLDLFYCWELHGIGYQDELVMFAVNANNRYTVVMAGLPAAAWQNPEEHLEAAIEDALREDGYTEDEIDRYFNLAGPYEITKTHGRKPVAGLNKAIDGVLWTDRPLNKTEFFQREIQQWLNNEDLYSPAGFDEYDHPAVFFRKDMKRVGII